MVIGRGLFLTLFGEIHMKEGVVITNSFPKLHVRHGGFHFMVPESQTRELTHDLTLPWPYNKTVCSNIFKMGLNVSKVHFLRSSSY